MYKMRPVPLDSIIIVGILEMASDVRPARKEDTSKDQIDRTVKVNCSRLSHDAERTGKRGDDP